MRHRPQFTLRWMSVSVGALWAAASFAGAAGPSVGNPNINEAAEDPEPRSSAPAVSSRKSASVSAPEPTKIYAAIEARHMMNEYFDAQGRRLRRDPGMHGQMQLGVRMYNDRLDISGTVGAVKLPGSQAFFQKRPEVLVDFYPLKSQYFNVLWYNMLQIPVREADRDPTEFADSDLYEKDSLRGIDSTVYMTGLAPVAKVEWRMAGGKYLVRGGADAWTKMYSKPLYIDDRNRDGNGVGLVKSDEEPVDKKFEDRALRYVHQESLAVGWSPYFLPFFSAEVGAYIESRYIPRYFRDDVGGWDYAYQPERRSFWRTRLNMDLTHTLSLQNDLYVFRNGFFAENRVNQERRFQNIVRMAVKL